MRSPKLLSWSSPRSLTLACALACGVGLLVPTKTQAFCGFYVAGADAKLLNNATVVVLMRDGTRTVLSMQNDYQGPPEAFALVIPVPVVLKEADVKTLRPELFDRVDQLAAPRLVEYWEEDPCIPDSGTIGLGNIGTIGKGGGGGSGYGLGSGSSTVTVEAEFAVGEYEIVILSATESSGLDDWLRENGYNIPAGAEPLLRPYVQQDMKFFVAKVNPKKVTFAGNGRAKLSPLRFHYDSKDFTLPVRLGLINAPDPASGGKQDLLVHVLAPGTRYQVANYPNATIPTNLNVKAAVKDRFGDFYVSLFDHTLEQNPGAVVTEYAWGAGSCDPCPGPEAALTQQELLELGGDVISSGSSTPGATRSTGSLPRVVVEPPRVGGPLDKDVIRRIVRAHMNEVSSCYNAGLAKNPSLAGRVVVDFVVDGQGLVSTAKVSDTTLGDATVGQCIAQAVKRWKFPKPRGGGLVTVSYPFVLAPSVGSPRASGPAGGGRGSSASTFVLTRLHARYDASSLAEDLVFEAAPAITGGRETPGQLGRGATLIQGGLNSFQARYAIRHEWAGDIECSDPVRGRWGGPSGGGATQPTLAQELTQVTRGTSLSSFVTASAGEQLGIGAVEIGEPPPAARPVKDATPAPTQPQAAPASTSTSTPAPAPSSGCACASTSQPDRLAAPFALLALLGLRRRR
ncbi:hypothetical protein DB30_04246 [Enhygromyxa salina]|uniref:Gram-negative bacterial tonB protein n=1 Tax=Enhygromyxa salina TaxID=215803 RepID=A0A0C2D9F5_9BACT|nr:TonB family protein [Enhygromyxa salina]KIG16627.1 hypothetical protein DB30_04246 [Enhygromyxa salina]